MATKNLIEFGTAAVALESLPIRPQWVLEGAPVARYKVLSVSDDGTAKTVVWDCTAGRFNWFYDVDETVYVLEGSFVLKDAKGMSRQVGPGETVFFHAGAHAEWTVDRYVRKIAFFRTPVPKYAQLASRAGRVFKRLTQFGTPSPERSAM
jgi:uncharacterized protein